MKQINYPFGLLKQMRNNEHFHLHKSILDYLGGKMDVLAVLVSKYLEYKTNFETLDEYTKTSPKYFETDELQLIRRERDDMFIAIKRITEGTSYHVSPEIKTAGKRLSLILANYKEAIKMPYASSVADIYNLIQDLRLPENTDFIDVLELDSSITLLEEKNNELDALFLSRLEKKGRKRLAGDTNLMRRAVDTAGKEMAELIDSLYKISVETNNEQEPSLSEIIDHINFIIAQAEDDYYQRFPESKPASKDQPDIPLSVDGPPRFRMKNQTLTELDEPGNRYAHSMTVEVEDREAFVSLLYPQALGAGIDMVPPEPLTPIYIEVEKFLTHSQNEDIIIGLVFVIRNAILFYVNPLDGTDIGPVMLMKDDKCIAILENLLYPKVEGMA